MTVFHKRHTQSVPSEKWVIDLPMDVHFPKVTQIYDSNKLPVSWQHSVRVIDGDLVIDFGLDEVAGIAEYTYETDEDTAVDPVIGANGGVINVHIHQYNTGTGDPK